MTRRILPLLLAVVLAALGTVAVLAYVATADKRALAGKKAVTVLIVVKRIPAGTPAGQVRSKDFTESKLMPAEAVPDGTLSSIGGELESLVTLTDLLPSQLVMRGQFGPEKKDVVGLPVPDGKLAISVQLSTVAAVAGYVVPGSKIAIFDSFNVKDDGTPAGDRLADQHEYNRATRILLPKVDVIAVGTFGVDGTTNAPQPEPSPSASSSGSGAAAQQQSGLLLVTVAVDQADAEKLVHGTETGTLYLGLLGETSTVKPGPGVDNRNVFTP